jgi:hypothetical protein
MPGRGHGDARCEGRRTREAREEARGASAAGGQGGCAALGRWGAGAWSRCCAARDRVWADDLSVCTAVRACVAGWLVVVVAGAACDAGGLEGVCVGAGRGCSRDSPSRAGAGQAGAQIWCGLATGCVCEPLWHGVLLCLPPPCRVLTTSPAQCPPMTAGWPLTARSWAAWAPRPGRHVRASLLLPPPLPPPPPPPPPPASSWMMTMAHGHLAAAEPSHSQASPGDDGEDSDDECSFRTVHELERGSSSPGRLSRSGGGRGRPAPEGGVASMAGGAELLGLTPPPAWPPAAASAATGAMHHAEEGDGGGDRYGAWGQPAPSSQGRPRGLGWAPGSY